MMAARSGGRGHVTLPTPRTSCINTPNSDSSAPLKEIVYLCPQKNNGYIMKSRDVKILSGVNESPVISHTTPARIAAHCWNVRTSCLKL
jgi:hypothetical protein